MANTAGMFVVNNVSFSQRYFPIRIVGEEFAFMKQTKAEFLEVRWRGELVGEDRYYVIATRKRVTLESLEKLLPFPALNQMQTAVRDDQIKINIKHIGSHVFDLGAHGETVVGRKRLQFTNTALGDVDGCYIETIFRKEKRVTPFTAA